MAKIKNKPRASYRKGAIQTRRVFTQRQVYLLAREHGATPWQAVIASAVVMAESSGRTDAVNHNSNGTWDAGLGQINQIHGYSLNDMKDPNKNMEAIKKVSGGFKDWTPWVAYNSGAYRRFMGKKDALLKAKGSSGAGNGKTSAGSAGGISSSDAQKWASFQGGLPGTQLVNGLSPIPFSPFAPLDPSGTGGVGDLLNFPTEITDTFRLVNRLFEARFWYQTGKVVLGVGAVIFGVNALMKMTTGISPVGAAVKAGKTAASIAATKGAGSATKVVGS